MRTLAIQAAEANDLDPRSAMVDLTRILSSLRTMSEGLIDGNDLRTECATQDASLELLDGLDEAIAAATAIANNL